MVREVKICATMEWSLHLTKETGQTLRSVPTELFIRFK